MSDGWKSSATSVWWIFRLRLIGRRNCFDAEYAGPLTRPRRKLSNTLGTFRAETICKRGTTLGTHVPPEAVPIFKRALGRNVPGRLLRFLRARSACVFCIKAVPRSNASVDLSPRKPCVTRAGQDHSGPLERGAPRGIRQINLPQNLWLISFHLVFGRHAAQPFG